MNTSPARRLRDLGLVVGELKPGARNAITDVPGVAVGHATLKGGSVNTGVTAVLPHGGNVFRDKVAATSIVFNGFGKTIGLVQVDELGAIETPILLTNTLSVGTAAEALVRYKLRRNPEIGVTTGTVNPVVGECNDSFLNDIRSLHVKASHIDEAISTATADVVQGAVGAGTGMSAYGLKGGIGSASRRLDLGQATYHLGILVLANFGRTEDLTVAGHPLGRRIAEARRAKATPDAGSIIIVLATDLPLSERQLRRVAKRTSVGLARTGSHLGHGSGDLCIAFTTANRIAHDERKAVIAWQALAETRIDPAFRAAAEATEEAVIDAMLAADPMVGRDGNRRDSLRDFLNLL
ncbi:MAG: S58 family peptidase [Alphaproteobacteria bacterium]|nr:S58 family peptidase [Alphaproteobacteria bacterium]